MGKKGIWAHSEKDREEQWQSHIEGSSDGVTTSKRGSDGCARHSSPQAHGRQ